VQRTRRPNRVFSTLFVDGQFQPVRNLQTLEPGFQASALGGHFGARVLIEVGIGFLERGFQRLLFLLPCPLEFL
jgi:hypothetical protein